MKYPVRRRKGEQGFALLLVFVLAAGIALMLYKQVPRVAFESERDKEQLLIDRGGQYQRAIQVYYATFKRYPARIEDLENTNDKRFLRRRYVDPFTGKDEWRIIHTNGLFLTDSKVQKPPAAANANGTGQTAANGTAPAPGGIGGIGTPAPGANVSSNTGNTGTNTDPNAAANGTDPNAPPPVNAMVAARPSDRTLPTNQTYSNPTAPGITQQGNQNQNLNQAPPNFNDPVAYPPISLYPNGYNAPVQGQQGQPGQNQPGQNQQGLNQQGLNQGVGINQPGANQLGLNQSGLSQQGQQGLNQALNPLNLNQQGLPNGGQPNNNGLTGGIIGAPGIPNGIQQNTIQQGLQQQGLIPPGQQFQNQQLPGQQQQFQSQQFQGQPGGIVQVPGQLPQGGAPGAPGSNPGLNMIQQLLTTPRAPPPGIGPATTDQSTGAAIAGVASKFAGPSIKSYGGRTDYSEWEFVFQPQQQQVLPASQQQNGQQQGGQQPSCQQTGTGPACQAPGPGLSGAVGPGALPTTPH